MRNALVIGGLVVVALLVGLYFVLVAGGGDSAQGSTTESSGSAVVVTSGGTSSAARPGLPGETGPALPQPGPGENPRDYVVGDIRVRDHRSGDNKPLDIPPNVHPAEGRAIPSTLTHEVGQKVKAVMLSCVASLPKEARGEHPRLEGQVIIGIKDKKVTVTKSTMQLRNITGDSVEPIKQCIESKTVGIENPAGDEPDLDNYSINISFAIP